MNRKLTTAIADLHFAPTPTARSNLLREGVAEARIFVTGNTGIDSLLQVIGMIRRDTALRERLDRQLSFIDVSKRMVLVTGHRRESFGEGFESICRALATLSTRPDVQIVYPVHLNPNVLEPVNRVLGGVDNVHLLQPLDYLPFVRLMDRSYLILTDSGGIQEEAPSLGKPVLVMREITERPEAVEAGTVQIVGTNEQQIVASVSELLDDAACYQRMSRAHNPYGDGRAAERIVRVLEDELAPR
jgi:UDP-N-acetylglucosamine 2-epimerase (non-hydrolysing)